MHMHTDDVIIIVFHHNACVRVCSSSSSSSSSFIATTITQRKIANATGTSQKLEITYIWGLAPNHV